MAAQGDSDAIDFKPFFDMVVGVLFILLILVAAQMFFAQWAPTQEQASARSAEQTRRERDEAIGAYLGKVEARLQAAGFAARLDRTNLSISLPLDQLSNEAAQKPFSRTLLEAMPCRTLPRPAERPCLPLPLSTLAGLSGTLSLAGPDPGATPAAAARLRGIALAAVLYGAEPALLDLRTPAGMPLLTSQFNVGMSPSSAGASERHEFDTFTLAFTFADAAS